MKNRRENEQSLDLEVELGACFVHFSPFSFFSRDASLLFSSSGFENWFCREIDVDSFDGVVDVMIVGGV